MNSGGARNPPIEKSLPKEGLDKSKTSAGGSRQANKFLRKSLPFSVVFHKFSFCAFPFVHSSVSDMALLSVCFLRTVLLFWI